jgi:hypothetical protein
MWLSGDAFYTGAMFPRARQIFIAEHGCGTVVFHRLRVTLVPSDVGGNGVC